MSHTKSLRFTFFNMDCTEGAKDVFRRRKKKTQICNQECSGKEKMKWEAGTPDLPALIYKRCELLSFTASAHTPQPRRTALLERSVFLSQL